MWDKEQMRYFAWVRMRELYKKNIEGASPEEIEKIKAEYKVAKTKLYREQFKQDFPKYEKQIADNEDLARLAQENIKKVIAPFYPPIQNEMETRESRLTEPGKAVFELKKNFFFCATVLALGSYDLIKYLFYETPPSIPINLLGIAVLTWIMHQKPPKDIDQPSNPRTAYDELWYPITRSFSELVQEMINHPTKYPARQYPNYKNFINNNENNTERSH